MMALPLLLPPRHHWSTLGVRTPGTYFILLPIWLWVIRWAALTCVSQASVAYKVFRREFLPQSGVIQGRGREPLSTVQNAAYRMCFFCDDSRFQLQQPRVAITLERSRRICSNVTGQPGRGWKVRTPGSYGQLCPSCNSHKNAKHCCG